MHLLDRIPWGILLLFAVFLGLAPFVPEPHLVEKVRMLMHGTLQRPVDIFDLFYHSLPIILILAKLIRIPILKKHSSQ